MNIKQLKSKIKNRKPMSEKKKMLLKGLVFGFLAGGLATITAVGVVGCAMTQGKSQENEPTQKRIAPRNAAASYDGTTWVFLSDLEGAEEGNVDLFFTSNGIACNILYGFYEDDELELWYVPTATNEDFRVYRQNHGGWQNEAYRTITLTAEPSADALAFLQTWATMEGGASSSSSESGGASSSVASSTIEEVSSSFSLQFSETNPFSAWAVNPSNLEPAVNYDSAAPWLLYTGNPSSETMGSVTSKYTIYDVGAFYIDGNPAQTFDAIALTTLTLSPDNSFVVGGSSEAQTVGQDAYNKGAFIVAKVHYLNTANQSRVQVMDFATTSAKLGNEQVNALTGPAWLNVGFRNIVYVGDNPNLSINGYDAPAAWWLKNNALSSSAAVATMLLGNAETGVFGLLASAFSGLGGILGIAIIPNLTIGTLMFIPLVVIIIFAIIKVLNK